MADLFPVFLKLEGRRCLVVGARTIAEQKIKGLLAAGADLRVVAPQVNEHIQRLAAEGKLRWTDRSFDPADLEGVFLAVAATGDPLINEQIFRECEKRGVLCNAVDEPARCHFYYPAVMRRGDLQIAISTNGQSPALAQRLRKELEVLFGADYEPWLKWLGLVRKLLFRSNIPSARRNQALHRIASRDVYERFVNARKRRVDAS